MAIYNLNNLYSPSDFLGGLTGLQTGTFTLRASATPDSIQITDDDPNSGGQCQRSSADLGFVAAVFDKRL